MNMNLPDRIILDEDYIAEIVGHPIKSFSLSEGAQKGDNIIGKMLALRVETDNSEDNGENETLHLVIKSLVPLTGELTEESLTQSQFFNALQVFPAEVAFYKEVRPLLQQATGYPSNTPRFYRSHLDGLNDFIALDDLRHQGYKMGDKRKGLSLQAVQMILQHTAFLHAHSYAAIIQNGEKIQELQSSSSVISGHVWEREVFDLDQSIFFNAIIEKMVEILQEQGDTVSCAQKMQRFAKVGHKTIMDLSRKTGESSKYFKVILHGDLWTNNVLLKFAPDGATVIDVAFIDYQQCRFGNIYEDLQYFFFTSTTAEFRKLHLRSCLHHYFNEFAQVLAKIRIPLPEGFTGEELIATFYENIEYGFCYNLVGIPFQLVDQGPPMEQPPSPSDPPKAAGPPSALAMALVMAQVMKEGTKKSPVAMQRLKELVKEMAKLNVIF